MTVSQSVSIVVISFDQEQYIRNAVESVLSQVVNFDIEILLCDDGSSDDTPKIMDYYSKKYPEIIKNISHQEHYGLSDNYRYCLNKCSKKYIAILEGDDYWSDCLRLTKMTEFMSTHPYLNMCFCDYKILTNESFEKSEWGKKNHKVVLKTKDFFKFKLNPINNLSCCVFKTDYIRSIPDSMYQYRFSEISLGLDCCNHGGVGFISEIMNVYRITQNGAWSGLDDNGKQISYYLTRAYAEPYIERSYKNKYRRYMYVEFYLNTYFMKCFKQELDKNPTIPMINIGITNMAIARLTAVIVKIYKLLRKQRNI